MSEEYPLEKSDEENPGEGEEEEGEFPRVVSEYFGEEKTEVGDQEFYGEHDQRGEYGEGGGYYIFRLPQGEGAEYASVWGEKEGSATSEGTAIPSEVEETEEEKEMRRERELLVEAIRQKIMNRMLLRRRNAFLQKKLVEHFKKRRMENVLKEEPKGLDMEGKYLKRLYAFQEFKQAQETEIMELDRTMAQYESDTKLLEEELDEKLKSFMAKAKEISLNLISSKTGKKINEKTVDRLLRRFLQKSEEKGKKKLRYIKIKNLIEEKEAQLKAMEYFGDGLHMVDYEQMKIDNQNFTDKIEEKEDELTKLRLKTQGIIQNFTNVREKSYAIEEDIELLEEKVYVVEKEFIETRERLTKAKKRRNLLRDEFARLKSVSGLLTRDDLLRDFESSIVLAKTLSKEFEKMKKIVNLKSRQEKGLAKVFSSGDIGPMDLKLTLKPKTTF